jgi:hypothetical protein
MRWKIDGADRETGEDRSILVQAENRGSAEQAASEMGILIAAVRAEEPHRLPPLEELSNDPDGENEALACLAEEWVGQGLPPPAPFGSDNRGLRIIARVLRTVAVLGYIAGTALAGWMIYKLVSAPVADARQVLWALAAPVAMLACAAVLHAIAQIARATVRLGAQARPPTTEPSTRESPRTSSRHQMN